MLFISLSWKSSLSANVTYGCHVNLELLQQEMMVEGGSIFSAFFFYISHLLLCPSGDTARQVMFAEEMSPSGCRRFKLQDTAAIHCKCEASIATPEKQLSCSKNVTLTSPFTANASFINICKRPTPEYKRHVASSQTTDLCLNTAKMSQREYGKQTQTTLLKYWTKEIKNVGF